MNKTGKRFGAALLLATTSLVTVGAAQGTVIFETKEFNNLATNDDQSAGAKTSGTTLTFNKFDPTLGTLTGVKFTLESFVSGTLTFNGEVFVFAGSGALDIDANLDFTASIDIVPLAGTSNFIKSDGTVGHCENFGRGTLLCNGAVPYSFAFSDPMLIVPGVDIDLFNSTLAMPTFDAKFLLSLEVTCTVVFGDSCLASGTSKWDLDDTFAKGRLTVEYTFREPVRGVPEPASLALFGAGLLGLGLARRRRKPT